MRPAPGSAQLTDPRAAINSRIPSQISGPPEALAAALAYAARGWPVLVFTKPVALQSRVSFPAAKPALAALAVGGFMAVGGVMWANARRRRLGA